MLDLSPSGEPCCILLVDPQCHIGRPNGRLHLRLRLRDFRGSQRDRRSRQVEAMLGPWPRAPPNLHTVIIHVFLDKLPRTSRSPLDLHLNSDNALIVTYSRIIDSEL